MIQSISFYKILILSIVGSVVCSDTIYGHVWEDYPLVRDERNFLESAGGKGVPAQGRVIKSKTTSRTFNQPAFADAPAHDWRYVVSVNCRRSDDVYAILHRLSTELLPDGEKGRLGILIGINERVTLDKPPTYSPTWDDILPNHADINALGIPITAVYSQWTSFREDPANKAETPQQIREKIHARINTLDERQRDVAKARLLKDDKDHQYPFGHMRTHILNCDAGTQFLQAMQGTGAEQKPVYVHIQDADFQDLRTQPLFYDGIASDDVPQVIPADQRLLSRYDALIQNRKAHSGMMPLFVGGGHVYSPDEEKEDTTPASRYWTRFASEMGNILKQSMGRVMPYGIYFHEPNTLILSPYSLGLVTQDAPGWSEVRRKFTKFSFGIDSEIQVFSRDIMQGCPDDTCRQLMVFSAQTVLATSMKRGGTQPDFSINYDGAYDGRENTFSGWALTDIKAIHGMSQEVMHANKWASMVCTGFQGHKKVDSRSQIASIFNFFDPYNRGTNERDFWRALVQFDDIIIEETASATIKALFQHLCGAYDKQGQGALTAFYILSQAWEAGQMMRILFLDHLSPPDPIRLAVPALRDTRKRLAYTLNFMSEDPYPIVPNQAIVDLLGLGKIPTTILPRDAVTEIVRRLYLLNKNVKIRTARALGTTSATVTKLMGGGSPRKAKKIYAAITGTPEQTLEGYGFNPIDVAEIRKKLF